jgi:hypothetical protein
MGKDAGGYMVAIPDDRPRHRLKSRALPDRLIAPAAMSDRQSYGAGGRSPSGAVRLCLLAGRGQMDRRDSLRLGSRKARTAYCLNGLFMSHRDLHLPGR